MSVAGQPPAAWMPLPAAFSSAVQFLEDSQTPASPDVSGGYVLQQELAGYVLLRMLPFSLSGGFHARY